MAKQRRHRLSETETQTADLSIKEPRIRSPIVHQTLYLPRPLYRQLRQLAAIHECRMHDLVLQGLDKIFMENGLKSRAELEHELKVAHTEVSDSSGSAFPST